MPIVSFDFDPELSAACIDLRYRLYAADPLWVAPLKARLQRYYQPRFPFYRRAGSRHRHFVVRANGTVLGHVSALVSSDLQQRHGAGLGLVGLFECVDDEALAGELLDAAASWLRAEHGVTRLWGPVSFDIWHEYRMKIGGFRVPPFYGEPYNPSYYPRLFERYGFRVLQYWESVEAPGAQVQAALDALQGVIARVLEAGYRIDKADWRCARDLDEMYALETALLAGASAYTGLSRREYHQVFLAHRNLLGASFSTILRAPDGRAVGLAIAYSDVADAVRSMRGEAGLPARDRLRRLRRQSRRGVLYFIGALGAQRMGHLGLGTAVGAVTLQRLLDHGQDSIVFALLAADSKARCFMGETIHDAECKYVLYEKRLP